MAHRKDCDPQETIQRARAVLAEVGLSVFEERWWSIGDRCLSVRLRIAGYPFLGVDGKGVTRLLTLASAYGELMERLQHQMLLTGTYGLMKAPGKPFVQYAPDAETVDFGSLWNNNQKLMKHLFSIPRSKIPISDEEPISCLPYYNLTDRRVDMLPASLIGHACGSNGMCAGNTPQEAVVHGLNEIFERHVVLRLFDEPLNCPNMLPQEMALDAETESVISAIQDAGCTVLVKDCTLGGTFPVVGTLIMNPASGRFRAQWGSDPYFPIALQRCLTETFQASTDLDSSSECLDRFWGSPAGSLNRVYQGRDQMPRTNWFLDGDGPSRHRGCFQADLEDNRSALRFQVELLRRQGKKVYVRDVSVLGFPAFSVYVPGLSESYSLNRQLLTYVTQRTAIREVLLNLPTADEAAIKRCAQQIEAALAIPQYRTSPSLLLNWLFGIVTDASSSFNDLLLPEILLTLLYNRVADYRSAHRILDTAIKKDLLDFTDIDPGYYLCGLSFFRLKADGVADEQIPARLALLFGPELAASIVEDLAEPRRSFQYVPLPTCGECSGCALADVCCYEVWRPFNETFARRLRQQNIDQRRLGELLP